MNLKSLWKSSNNALRESEDYKEIHRCMDYAMDGSAIKIGVEASVFVQYLDQNRIYYEEVDGEYYVKFKRKIIKVKPDPHYPRSAVIP